MGAAADEWAIAKWPVAQRSRLRDAGARFRAMVEGRGEDRGAHCLHSAQPAFRRPPECGCGLRAAAHHEVLPLRGGS